jgi:transcriptional regulator with XRE-family HTH domain
MSITSESRLGAYLKDRRARLDPASLGFAEGRRRTPGLRREEVAQRANISPAWYTWLEQGRGGAPSASVLERIAEALMLTEVEREHLFLLGLGRPPEPRYPEESGVTPRLQRVLDALNPSPSLIKTSAWDVVAWNEAAATVLTDYSQLPPEERNILRLIFLNPRVRAAQSHWEGVARFVVDAFRIDAARAGEKVVPLIAELSARSPDFARLWAESSVRSFSGGVKHLQHPDHGALALEYSAFGVDGRADLTMLVYNPASAEDAEQIKVLIAARQTRQTEETAHA